MNSAAPPPVYAIPAGYTNGVPLQQCDVIYVHTPGPQPSFLFKLIAIPACAIFEFIGFGLRLILTYALLLNSLAMLIYHLTLHHHTGPVLDWLRSFEVLTDRNPEQLFPACTLAVVLLVVQDLVFKGIRWVWVRIFSYEDGEREVVMYTVPQGNPHGAKREIHVML